MITKEVIAVTKTESNLEFTVKVSVPLTEISSEMAEDCTNMFNREFPITTEWHIDFKVDETGKETISLTVAPKKRND